LTATVFSLKHHKGVFVSDLASSHTLRLPEHEGRWERFLDGKTLATLLNYVDHLLAMQDRVLTRMEEHEEEQIMKATDPSHEGLKGLGSYSFFTPSKKRKAAKGEDQEVEH
ncbi:hypothetical protein EC968_010449, partial [Mortierella alpina]